MLAPPRPPQDELELLIKEARERQLRRRLLGAAGVAVVAAIGLSVYVVASDGRSGSTAVRPPITGPPICRSSQLAAAAEFNGAAGSLIGFVMISERSQSSCSLPVRRPRVLITTDGNSNGDP